MVPPSCIPEIFNKLLKISGILNIKFQETIRLLYFPIKNTLNLLTFNH